MKRNATALRAFTHAGENIAKGQTILGMDAGQFGDWSAEGTDLVREATDAEVARAKGEPAAKAPSRPPAKRKAKVTPTKPAPAPDPTPPAATEPASDAA